MKNFCSAAAATAFFILILGLNIYLVAAYS
jgi:hypothetical protein